jgi:dTDP-4-dehydrorhamnose 3,5-epimerase
MIFEETKLKGAFIVDIKRLEDERGFFARTYCHKEFSEHGMMFGVLQTNMSTNRVKGTLRGMHYQKNPYQETKFVRCIKGALYDVIVDLRPESPTYKEWIGVELSEDNQRAIFVPKDFAHGFITLIDDTTIFYMASQFYTPGAESGIRWNDPALRIEWPVKPQIISVKDSSWNDFAG